MITQQIIDSVHITLPYEPNSGKRETTYRTVTGHSGDSRPGLYALRGEFLKANRRHVLPVGLPILKTVPTGSVKNSVFEYYLGYVPLVHDGDIEWMHIGSYKACRGGMDERPQVVEASLKAAEAYTLLWSKAPIVAVEDDLTD